MINLKKSRYVNVDVLVGVDTVFDGNITSKSAIKIDGRVQGDIVTDHEVILTETGKVLGNVKALSLVIAGKVSGDVDVSQQLLIKATGVLEGNAITSSLVIEEGGSFFGRNESKQKEPSAKETLKTDGIGNAKIEG